jgi:adenylate cyclase
MASTRRLAAILAADVAGYSRLMGVDEEGTHERLRAHLRELVDPKIAEYHGRTVKSTGDGLLVEFPSVVDAVRCAAEVQRTMIDREAEMPEDRRIRYRIGINLGDVIVEDGDIFGDGVNMAARLERLPSPAASASREWSGTRSETNFPTGSKIAASTALGTSRPVRVFALGPEAVADLPASGVPSAGPISPPAVAPRQSIVVLPFANLSDDREQQYFADGISDTGRMRGALTAQPGNHHPPLSIPKF